jgi:hypothetical protein
MRANELIRRFCRAAELAAQVAGLPAPTGLETSEDMLDTLETVLRDRLLVAARHGCPHDLRHVAWDQATRDWRCICGQAMNLDGSTR